MQTVSFTTLPSSVQRPAFILAPAPPPRRRRAVPCPPPPSGRRHSLARKVSFGRFHCTTPNTTHQTNFLSLIDTPVTASLKTPKTPAPQPRALQTLGYNISFAVQNTPISKRFVPIPSIMLGNNNSSNNNNNNNTKADAGRKRSKSVGRSAAPRHALPMSYAQQVQIDQLFGGGSDNHHMRKVQRQVNKNGRGLDAGLSGDVGYGGAFGAFKDENGAIWYDAEEMQEYASLLESKGPNKSPRPTSWVAFNSEPSPPDSPTYSTDGEDQPMEVLDDQLANYGGLLSANPPQFRSVLTMPRRNHRVHLSGKSGFLFPAARRNSASSITRSYTKCVPPTPKGKDRRRPPPLDLMPLDSFQIATNSPAPATAPVDDIDGMIAFLASSFKPAPASPSSSVTPPPLPTRRRRSRSGSIALHPCKVAPPVANPTSLGNQRRRSLIEALAMFPTPPTTKPKASLGGMFKMGFGSKRK